VVARGIATSQGRAVPGVVVRLYAWPSDAVLQSLRPGQQVPMRLLASTTTSSAGWYALAVPRAALKAAAVDQGWANLEVATASGAWWDFTYQTGRAKTVTVNLNLAGLPQCPMHTATGYDLHGHMNFQFGHSGWLCGTNGNDATAAQLVARGTKP
jgi:hypothetical protein